MCYCVACVISKSPNGSTAATGGGRYFFNGLPLLFHRTATLPARTNRIATHEDGPQRYSPKRKAMLPPQERRSSKQVDDLRHHIGAGDETQPAQRTRPLAERSHTVHSNALPVEQDRNRVGGVRA